MRWLVIPSFILATLLTSIFLNVFLEPLYQFERLGVLRDYPEAHTFNHGILRFLQGAELPKTYPLTDQEISHMIDVRGVFYLGYALLALSLSLLFSFSKKRTFADWLRSAANANLIFSVGLLLAFALFFSSAFTLFHHLFFAEGTWLFSPSDILVSIYPQQFFLEMAIRIFLTQIALVLLTHKVLNKYQSRAA